MALTDRTARNAKANAKQYKLADAGGLYLLVTPQGGKYWRLKYRFGGKEKVLALGTYPDVPLATAREKRDQARKLLASGADPSEHRKAAKVTRAGLAANTLEVIGREWYAKTAPTLADTTKEKLLRRLEVDVFPVIGARPIASLAAADLIRVIERIEQRGAPDIAKRVHNSMGRIFRYAVGRGLVSRDPSRDIELKDILSPADVQHHASVTEPTAVGGLLSVQAAAVLREIQPLTGGGRYVFPSERRRRQTHEREHHQRGAAPAGIRQGRNDRARLPIDGVDALT